MDSMYLIEGMEEDGSAKAYETRTFIQNLFPGIQNQEHFNELLKEVRSTPVMEMFFEGLTKIWQLVEDRLDEMEKVYLCKTKFADIDPESDKNIKYIEDLFGLEEKKEEESSDPLRTMRESFKDYFEDITDPVEFLESIRENNNV